MIKIFALIFYLGCFSFKVFSADSPRTVKFITVIDENDSVFDYLKEFYQEVFKGIPDYKLEIVSVPSARAELLLVSDSSFVGDLGRVAEFKKRHADLIQVPLIYRSSLTCVVYIDSKIDSCDEKTLRKHSFSVRKGAVNVQSILAKKNLHEYIEYSTFDQGLKQLHKQRVEILLLTRIKSDEKVKFVNTQERYKVVGALSESKNYLYIKPEYHDLARKIKIQIEKVKNGKEVERLFKKYLVNPR